MTKNYGHNPYDNSEVVMENEVRDIAAGYDNTYDAMRAEKEYYETLMKRHQLLTQNDGKITMLIRNERGVPEPTPVQAKYIVAAPSEFESVRLNVLMRLNDPQKTSPATLKMRMAQFETDSVFELSSKIANYVIDQKRKKLVADKYSAPWKVGADADEGMP